MWERYTTNGSMIHMTDDELTIGVDMRFDGLDGISAEKLAFDEEGESRNVTTRQQRRRQQRQGEKALLAMLKDEARKMGRGAGGAAIRSRQHARRVFQDMLDRGEKVLKAPDLK
jgi:hypothetical protein